MSSSDTTFKKEQKGLSTEQLKLITNMFDEASMFVCIIEGPDHRIRYHNKALRRLLGYRDIQEGTPVSLILPDLKNNDWKEIDSTLKMLDHVYSTGQPIIRVEQPVYLDRNRDGSLQESYFNFVHQPLKNPDGKIAGQFVAGYEVSDRVKARRDKILGEQRLQIALEGAAVGFWEIEPTTKQIIRISEHCRAQFGFTPDEPVSYDSYIEAIHPDDRDRLLEETKHALQTQELYEVEYRVQRPDGSQRWLVDRGQCVCDENGQPYRLIGITMNISQYKRSERKLKEAVKLRDDFLSIASHELQTPLTTIKIQTDLLEQRLRKMELDRDVQHAEMINKNIDQLSQLISNLLDISHIQEGKLQTDMQPLSLREIIEHTAASADLLSHHDIVVEGDASLQVNGDRVRLEQVLTNLLNNAIKYSPDADRIIVRYGKKDERAVVSVVDFGLGIPKENRLRVFERFFKESGKKKASYPGFGIGLYLTRQIIERHGGGIWVEDNPEGGSIFSFSLPI